MRVFKDRVEVTNPGRLVPELTIAKLRIDHASYPTNPLLAECLYQVQYIERFGTGTMDMIQLSRDAHLNEPEFDLDEGFKVVLWRPSAQTDQVSDQVSDQVDELIKRLVLVIGKPSSRSELMQALNLKHNTYFRKHYLNPALDGEFIKMTDPESLNSPQQRYALTEKGIALKKAIEKE